jgi:hypothetical protein
MLLRWSKKLNLPQNLLNIFRLIRSKGYREKFRYLTSLVLFLECVGKSQKQKNSVWLLNQNVLPNSNLLWCCLQTGWAGCFVGCLRVMHAYQRMFASGGSTWHQFFVVSCSTRDLPSFASWARRSSAGLKQWVQLKDTFDLIQKSKILILRMEEALGINFWIWICATPGTPTILAGFLLLLTGLYST